MGPGEKDGRLTVGAFEHEAVGMAVETDFEPFDVVFFVDALGDLYFLPGVAVARMIRLSFCHGVIDPSPGRFFPVSSSPTRGIDYRGGPDQVPDARLRRIEAALISLRHIFPLRAATFRLCGAVLSRAAPARSGPQAVSE